MEHDEGKLRLWLAHRSALVDYASGVTGCHAQAEDVVQDAYLRFVPAKVSAEVGLAHPVGYLYRIVRNLALDWARRRGRETSAALPEDMAAPATTDPERQAAGRAELRRAARVVAHLPARTRAAFLLHRIEGLPLREVARRLEVSTPTAHRLVRDALMRVAACLDDSDA